VGWVTHAHGLFGASDVEEDTKVMHHFVMFGGALNSEHFQLQLQF
jgi:hypothetical protein